MNPYVVLGLVAVGGALLYASGAQAAGDEECEIGVEYAFAHGDAAAVMIRECTLGDNTYWLWDAGLLDEVELGPDEVPNLWPEVSLVTGHADTEQDALDAATAWVEANTAFILSGGVRGPFAERVEDFLAGLTLGQIDALRETFRLEGTAVSDAWPYVEQLRVSSTDEEFFATADKLADKLTFLNEEETAAMRNDILASIGIMHGLALKSILTDAGVM